MKRIGVVGGLAYAALLTVLLAIAYALSNGEVLGRGRLVGAVDHDVVKVRILNRYEAFADETIMPLGSDLMTSLGLMVVAGMALLSFAVAVKARPDDVRLQLFFLLSAAGVTFLAFDEQYEFIDSLGYNVEALYIPDIVFYTPPALLFAYVFRRILLASRPAFLVLAAGAALFLGAQALDRLPHDRFEGAEEKAEALATVVLAIGFSLVAVHHLAPALTPAAPRQAEL